MNNINKYDLENKCCGCMACANICPFDAIDISCNEKGFFVPQVKTEKCRNCGKCLQVCQINNQTIRYAPFKKYALVNNDDVIRSDSSSGGVFWMIVNEMFSEYNHHFHCVGVKFDDKLNVIYSIENCIDDCVAFRGSKYVQARIDKTFIKITELLVAGEIVLFVGTGCQCAGLKNYLNNQKINTENLYVIDIICHGTPSQKMWKDYIKVVENTYSKKISSYKFRDKKHGWRGMHPVATTTTGELIKNDDLFLSYCRCFGNLSLNEACYSCQYANCDRIGDITIGDYWGIEKSSCSFDDNKGVSICLINTSKGSSIFDKISDKAKVYEVKDNSFMQPQLCKPTKKNILTEAFWEDYQRYGYIYISKKYASKNKFIRVQMKCLAHIKNFFEKIRK